LAEEIRDVGLAFYPVLSPEMVLQIFLHLQQHGGVDAKWASGQRADAESVQSM
jgi:hypothetical protein